MLLRILGQRTTAGLRQPPAYALALRAQKSPYSSLPPSSSSPHSRSSPSSATATDTTVTPSPTAYKSSPLLQKYAPRLAALSERTRTPLPSLALSFLILHELTAIVPVVALYYLLHWAGAGAAVVLWLSHLGDSDNSNEGDGGEKAEGRWHHKVSEWAEEGMARAERVGRRYGILGYEKRAKGASGEEDETGQEVAEAKTGIAAGRAVADAVAAYVLVKALLPVRIAVSVGAAPAFARFALEPVRRVFARFWR